MTVQPITASEFKPRIGLRERYSIENMANRRGLTVEEFKDELGKEREMLQALIDKRLAKGYTQEQAETEAYRCMYIPGFSGPTFTD
jgi:hypothetical protein